MEAILIELDMQVSIVRLRHSDHSTPTIADANALAVLMTTRLLSNCAMLSYTYAVIPSL
jgi:hypothetical protein